ncbi:MAG TPA: MOSC domain-containing protein [Gammaproteobacteria bacterium]
MNIQDRIEGVFIGAIAPLTGERDSAIVKHAVGGSIELTPLGLCGDMQADRVNHGGPERALLHYCARHYAVWAHEFPDVAGRFAAPGFGENLSSANLDEENVCIGDLYLLGTARVQVSQPRSPCWKLDAHLGVAGLARRVQDTQRCGWLYRVLEPGRIAAGDRIELLQRPNPDFSVAAVMRAVNAARVDRDSLVAIAALPELSANWRGKAERRLSGDDPDSRARLQGTPP